MKHRRKIAPTTGLPFIETATRAGGVKALAKMAGVAPSTAYGWRNDTIPAKHTARIERGLAKLTKKSGAA